MVSVYCPSSEAIDGPFMELQRVLDGFGCVDVLLAGDFNARSGLWHDVTMNRRGVALEDFIVTGNFCVVNEPGFPSTFLTANGNSWVDLTLCTDGFVRLVRDWEVVADLVSSDYRVVRARCLAGGQRNVIYKLAFDDFKDETVGRELGDFCEVLLGRYPVLVAPGMIDAALGDFYDGLEQILADFGEKKADRPDYWPDKIERLRRVYLAKKSLLYSNRVPNRAEHLAVEMGAAIEKYKKELKKRKEASWREFVERDLGPNP